jgi:hypothetical protein
MKNTIITFAEVVTTLQLLFCGLLFSACDCRNVIWKQGWENVPCRRVRL